MAHLGEIVSALGTSQFSSRFFGLFNEMLAIDQCTVFAFRGDEPPDALVLEGASSEMRKSAHALAHEYVAGAFTHDPNVHASRHLDGLSVYCLRAAEVQDRAYRARFYDRACLAHELVMLGRVDDTLYYSSFYRTNTRAGFQSAEVETIGEFSQFALRALRRHVELLGGVGSTRSTIGHMPSANKRPQLLAHLTHVLLAEPYMLSPREAEVCAGIVLGLTTVGISLRCGISINTVATHRKRAYRKLGVSSQNELFSRYFRLVNQEAATLACVTPTNAHGVDMLGSAA